MKRLIFILTIFLALMFATMLTFVGRGYIFHYVFVMGNVVWIGVPLLVLSMMILALGTMFRVETLNWLSIILFAFCAFIFIQILSLPGGNSLYKHDIRESLSYCENLAQKIDDYKRKRGYYPETLVDLDIKQNTLPRLLRTDDFYSRASGKYKLTFLDPKTLNTYYQFESKNRSWRTLEK